MQANLSEELRFVKAVAEQAYSSGLNRAADNIRGFVGYANGRVFKFRTHWSENLGVSSRECREQMRSCRDLRAMLATVSNRFLARIQECLDRDQSWGPRKEEFKATLHNLGIEVNEEGPHKCTCAPMAELNRKLLSRKILADWVDQISQVESAFDNVQKKPGIVSHADLQDVVGRARVKNTSFDGRCAGWGTRVGTADFFRDGDFSEQDFREALKTLKCCTLFRDEFGVGHVRYANGPNRRTLDNSEVVRLHALFRQVLVQMIDDRTAPRLLPEIARNLATLDRCIRSWKTAEGERSFVRWDGHQPQEDFDYDSAIAGHLKFTNVELMCTDKKSDLNGGDAPSSLPLDVSLLSDRFDSDGEFVSQDPSSSFDQLFDRDVGERWRVFARTAEVRGLHGKLKNLWKQAFGAGGTSAAKACWDDLAECALSMLGLPESSPQRILAKAQLEKNPDYGRLLKYLPSDKRTHDVERAFSAAFLASVEWIGFDEDFFNRFARKETWKEIETRRECWRTMCAHLVKRVGEAKNRPVGIGEGGEPKAAGMIDVSKLGRYWFVDNPQGFGDLVPDHDGLSGKELREDWTKRLLDVFGIKRDNPEPWRLLLNRLGFDPRIGARMDNRLTEEEVTTVNARISEIMAREAETRRIMRRLALSLKDVHTCGEGVSGALSETVKKTKAVPDLKALQHAILENGELSVEVAVNVLLSEWAAAKDGSCGFANVFLQKLAEGIGGIDAADLASRMGEETGKQLADRMQQEKSKQLANRMQQETDKQPYYERISDLIRGRFEKSERGQIGFPEEIEASRIDRIIAWALAGAVLNLKLIDLGDCRVLLEGEKMGESLKPEVAKAFCQTLQLKGKAAESLKAAFLKILDSAPSDGYCNFFFPPTSPQFTKTLKLCREFNVRDIPKAENSRDPQVLLRRAYANKENAEAEGLLFERIDPNCQHVPVRLFRNLVRESQKNPNSVEPAPEAIAEAMIKNLLGTIGDPYLREFAKAQLLPADDTSRGNVIRNVLDWARSAKNDEEFLTQCHNGLTLKSLTGEKIPLTDEHFERALWNEFEKKDEKKEIKVKDELLKQLLVFAGSGTITRKFNSTITVQIPYSQGKGAKQAESVFAVRTNPIQLEGSVRGCLVNIAESSLGNNRWLRLGQCGLLIQDAGKLKEAFTKLKDLSVERRPDHAKAKLGERDYHVSFDFTFADEAKKMKERDETVCDFEDLHIRLPIQLPSKCKLAAAYELQAKKGSAPQQFAKTKANIAKLILKLEHFLNTNPDETEKKIFKPLLENVRATCATFELNVDTERGLIPFAEKLMLLTVRAGFVPSINCQMGRDRTGAMDSSLKMMLAKYEALKGMMEKGPALELTDKDILSAIELTPDERLRAIDMTQNDEIARETDGFLHGANLAQGGSDQFVRCFLPNFGARLDESLNSVLLKNLTYQGAQSIEYKISLRPVKAIPSDEKNDQIVVHPAHFKDLLNKLKDIVKPATNDTIGQRYGIVRGVLAHLEQVRQYSVSQDQRNLATWFFRRFCARMNLNRWQIDKLEEDLPSKKPITDCLPWDAGDVVRAMGEAFDFTIELVLKEEENNKNNINNEDDENDENNINNEYNFNDEDNEDGENNIDDKNNIIRESEA